MTEFLVRHFVKDYEQVEKVSVRTAYGVLASVVGIFCNVVLFLVKGAAGILMHSISVTADAVSYTHLDVYKRQVASTPDIFRMERKPHCTVRRAR